MKAKPTIGFVTMNGHPSFKAQITLRNIGQTPAKDLTYYMTMVFDDDPSAHVKSYVDAIERGQIDWSDAHLFPDEKMTRAVVAEHDGDTADTKIFLIIAASYRTPFDKRRRLTIRVADVIDMRRYDKPLQLNDLPFGEHLYFAINRSHSGYAS